MCVFHFIHMKTLKWQSRNYPIYLRKTSYGEETQKKKKKDLADVVDFHEELISKWNKVKFVCSSYKGMPPVGMEMIGPLLINLSSEVGPLCSPL